VVLAGTPRKPSAAPSTILSKTNSKSLYVQYTIREYDGGSPILSYELQMDDGKGGDFVSLIGYDENYLKLSYIVEGNVIKGKLYRFRYRTKNSVGWSLFSDTGFIQAANVPNKPPVPMYVSSTTTSITMNFQQTDDSGGTPVIRYKVYRDAGDDFTSSYVEMTSYDGQSSQFTATVAADNLVTGKIYRFVYVAANSLGNSAYSNEMIAGIGAAPAKPNAPKKNVQLSN